MTKKWIDVQKKREENAKLARVAHCMDNHLREENHELRTHYNTLNHTIEELRDRTRIQNHQLMMLQRHLRQLERNNETANQRIMDLIEENVALEQELLLAEANVELDRNRARRRLTYD